MGNYNIRSRAVVKLAFSSRFQNLNKYETNLIELIFMIFE